MCADYKSTGVAACVATSLRICSTVQSYSGSSGTSSVVRASPYFRVRDKSKPQQWVAALESAQLEEVAIRPRRDRGSLTI